VWLLKHFLYKPILNAIDAREKRIAAELADADAKKAEAEKERDDFEAKNKAFDDQRSRSARKAEGDAKARTSAFSAKRARTRTDCARSKPRVAKRQKRGWAERSLAWPLGKSLDIARKTLVDLATVSLEERMARCSRAGCAK
jgi:F-type H+-transporting ATPase subunit b